MGKKIENKSTKKREATTLEVEISLFCIWNRGVGLIFECAPHKICT
jgi:hypothetical protein